jgi:hypothetical protein
MKKMFKIKTAYRLLLIACFLFLFPKISQAATTYYVDNTTISCSTPSDNDYDPATDTCGSGSYTVYNTIQGCADAVTAGDTCIVADGTYTDSAVCGDSTCAVVMKSSGTSGNPITFKAENKWGAKLDGTSVKRGFAWPDYALCSGYD